MIAVLARCFRCYFVAIARCFSLFFGTAGFKKPEFLRLSDARPLYFPGLSAVSASEAGRLSEMRATHQGVSDYCQDHRPTQARRCNNPLNGVELPITFGIAEPSPNIDVCIAMGVPGARCRFRHEGPREHEDCPPGKGAAGPGRQDRLDVVAIRVETRADYTVGWSHYAAALRKYWEIPAWRRAIASTSPLSASLSSA